VSPVYALPAVAAYAAGVQVKTLRTWVYRGHISEQVRGCYDLVEVLAWVERRRGLTIEQATVRARYGVPRTTDADKSV